MEDWEKQAIIDFPLPRAQSRRASRSKEQQGSQKGNGFKHPLKAHQHWHVDISYINAGGTFFYLITVLDGYSRYIVHHELRESMTELDVEIVCQAALEKHPGVTHVRTSPYYPQSNGKLERWHKSLKSESIRPNCPRDAKEAIKLIGDYVRHYNELRLHSTLGYVTPADYLAGLAPEIHAERDRKLEEARQRRRSASRDAELATAG